MNLQEVISKIVPITNTIKEKVVAFAPANIALVKYWGKRDAMLNLPNTSSLSISLTKGTTTELSISTSDSISLNGVLLSSKDPFSQRLFSFIDLFRDNTLKLHIATRNDIPTAAGLASSASGFAALTLALNAFFEWNLTKKDLSILARIGSGSASRSIYNGFVVWHKGVQIDGMDSFAEPLYIDWPELRIAPILISQEKKAIDSRTAMNETVRTSRFYSAWVEQVEHDMHIVQKAITEKDFELLGATAEHNALSMHATMLTAIPSICYWHKETMAIIQKIWQIRKEGISVYFTMDAGPNIKLLFQEKESNIIQELFGPLELMAPYTS